MAMNAATLATAMRVAILAALEAKYADPPDDQNLPGYTYEDYLDDFCTAVSTSVVAHIQANAKCNGLDTGGDGHAAVGIV